MTEQLYPHIAYQNNELYCEGLKLKEIAEKQGTPLYVYSYNALIEQYKAFTKPFDGVDHLVCFSAKANSNKAILKTFFNLGSGVDVVSGGEFRRALEAGCDPQKIVFSGVGKTSEEIHYALDQGLLQFNVESEQELLNIQRIASFLDKRAPIAIRVNPDVDAKTHPYISTGLKKNKFGVSHTKAVDLYLKAKDMSHIDIVGIDCHIGSQLVDVSPFEDALNRVRDLVLELRDKGIQIKNVDVGGGLGIRYKDEDVQSPEVYAQSILKPLKDLGCRILFEPGRFMVGNAGLFVTKVVYLKQGEDNHHFTIVDGAFNDLMRPMLYQAYHNIVPLQKIDDRKTVSTSIVGPICESTDCFGSERDLQLTGPGEYLAILSCGAYGMTMASTYNSRGRPSEVLVKDKEFYVIKKPDRLEDITKREAMPEFLKDRF